MPLAVRRVGGVSEAEQTYTLGPEESFRLDAASFRITYAQQGFNVAPTLICRDKGGFTFAEIAAPIVFTNEPAFNVVSYSGPAALSDTYSVLPPSGYVGYVFNDFGAPVVTSQLTVSWDQPPGLFGFGGATFLRSAGAVTMGAVIGTATVIDSATVAVTLTSPIAAGHYLLLQVTLLSPTSYLHAPPAVTPTVTDTVGGNVLDFSALPIGAWANTTIQRTDGLYLSSFVEFYRIVNPLPAGATVTLSLATGPAQWLAMNVHDIAGLTVGNPGGPNPGGNYVGIGANGPVSPATSTGVPTPKWTGPVLFTGSYIVPLGSTLDTQFSRGGVEVMPVPLSFDSGSQTYSQATLPDLHFGPGDTITAASFDKTGLRIEDAISNFLVYGVDE